MNISSGARSTVSSLFWSLYSHTQTCASHMISQFLRIICCTTVLSKSHSTVSNVLGIVQVMDLKHNPCFISIRNKKLKHLDKTFIKIKQ